MIILLNGTSSAGKTTIAKMMQEKYREVLLLYGVDTMVQLVFPEKCDYPPFDEKAIRLINRGTEEEPYAELVVSPYMYPVYRAAAQFYKILSEQGYNVIVDEVLFDRNRITPYFEILAGETVYFFGIKPEKNVVIQREKDRGDRIPGLAEGLYDRVYDPDFMYDLLLDSGKLTPEESAEKILNFIDQNAEPEGFKLSAKKWLK
jgi:chloramphenicol 3-O phosphotransferase